MPRNFRKIQEKSRRERVPNPSRSTRTKKPRCVGKIKDKNRRERVQGNPNSNKRIQKPRNF